MAPPRAGLPKGQEWLRGLACEPVYVGADILLVPRTAIDTAPPDCGRVRLAAESEITRAGGRRKVG